MLPVRPDGSEERGRSFSLGYLTRKGDFALLSITVIVDISSTVNFPPLFPGPY